MKKTSNPPEPEEIQPFAGTEPPPEAIAEPPLEPPAEPPADEVFAKFAKENGLTDPEELAGFKAQIRGDSPSDPNNAPAMRGWVVAWGFLAAYRGEFAHFPLDPDYRQGYEMGTKYVNSPEN